MTKRRPHVPIGLPIAAVITFILGFVARSVIQSLATEEQLATNVLLSAIPFVFMFVSIILLFITFIWLVASVLNDNIAERIYRPIEWIIIAGIVLGILGMFQPWWFAAYRYGFLLLFFSTLGFIVWSHIVPRAARSEEEIDDVSIGELEPNQAGSES